MYPRNVLRIVEPWPGVPPSLSKSPTISSLFIFLKYDLRSEKRFEIISYKSGMWRTQGKDVKGHFGSDCSWCAFPSLFWSSQSSYLRHFRIDSQIFTFSQSKKREMEISEPKWWWAREKENPRQRQQFCHLSAIWLTGVCCHSSAALSMLITPREQTRRKLQSKSRDPGSLYLDMKRQHPFAWI